ncbi:MAG TPA: HAD-IA family hydrolase [Balneolaceae bacterium]|nr:HAD-IA family hydrolase [Balneolaceae bacterium]
MSESDKITTLFLDIGGVLLTNGWDRYSRRDAVEKFDLDYDELNERHHLTFDTYEEGKISLDEYLDRVVFYEDRAFTKEEFRDFMFEQSEAYPEMIQYIRNLKRANGLRVTVVSNEGRELNDYRISAFDLHEFVDAFISSSFVHYRKPDEDIFRMALDVSQVDPQKVVYIDDRRLFVQIAGDLGINGIHHKGLESTRKILSEKYNLRVRESVAQ